MNWIMDPNIWLALLTLSAIEIVLGVDNIVFIAILAGKLPEHQNAGAELSAAHRHLPGGRRAEPAYPQRVYLFCHGVFNIR